VYRDQEFSADMNSRGVKRIGDVSRLRAAQFPQDSGPMAGPRSCLPHRFSSFSFNVHRAPRRFTC